MFAGCRANAVIAAAKPSWCTCAHHDGERIAVLTLLGMTHIHRMNALKNVLGTLINGVAVVAFIIAGAVRWAPGIVMIAGGITGGYAGAAIARRISPKYVRWVVMAIAWGMTTYFFVKTYR